MSQPVVESGSIAYLDHAATTPMRPEAREAMLPWLGERFGNPSGAHAVARAARKAIDDARDTVAGVLGCEPNDVVFTGGGTEADNTAIRGVLEARPGTVLCSAIEHHAVLHLVQHLGGHTIGVDTRGRLDLDELTKTLQAHSEVALVSVMLANNEVGTVQPLPEVVKLVRRHVPGAVVHSDAVQAAAWFDLREPLAGVDLISVTGHKLGGPQGTGALIVRRGTPLRPWLIGGGQERELRSGTHNVAGIVGFAAALEAASVQREASRSRVGALRDRLATGLLTALPGAVETAAPDGDRSHLLPCTLHVTIPRAESEALLFLLDEAGVCASAASACASGAQEASHVLAAMGAPMPLGGGALRLSLGWTTTDADVDRVLNVLPAAVDQLQAAASQAVGSRS